VVSLQVAFALGVGLSQAFDGDVPSLRRPESLAFAAPAASFIAGFFMCWLREISEHQVAYSYLCLLLLLHFFFMPRVTLSHMHVRTSHTARQDS